MSEATQLAEPTKEPEKKKYGFVDRKLRLEQLRKEYNERVTKEYNLKKRN